MENEYGEAGLDGALLEQDRLKVWQLTEGCICCSLKSDFASSILTIANTLNPEYLIVEPTGVGLLSAVLRNIGKIEYERIELLEPLTLVDVNCVDAYLKRFFSIYSDQIKSAPRILLSKIEHIAEHDLRRITDLLQKMNPCAEILSTPYQNQDEAWFHALLERRLHRGKEEAGQGVGTMLVSDLEQVSLTGIAFDTVHDLLEWLVALLRGYFGTVYRAKGFLPICGQWTKFDIVDKQYTVTRCAPMHGARAVIIGHKLDRLRLMDEGIVCRMKA